MPETAAVPGAKPVSAFVDDLGSGDEPVVVICLECESCRRAAAVVDVLGFKVCSSCAPGAADALGVG